MLIIVITNETIIIRNDAKTVLKRYKMVRFSRKTTKK